MIGNWLSTVCDLFPPPEFTPWFGPWVFLLLATICALQYLHQMGIRDRQRQREQEYQVDRQALTGEVQTLMHDRTVTRMENQILRDILSQNEFGKALQVLLRWFVPNSQEGFSAFVKVEEQHVKPVQTRGISDESCQNLQFDPEWIPLLQAGQTIVLEGVPLQRSSLFASLERHDRLKTRQVFIAGIGEGDGLFAALITTVLQPLNAPRDQQLELTRRMLLAVSGNLRHVMHLEQQSHQLQSTREMLELRSIADGHFEPMKMLEKFLLRLGQMVGAERGVVFLSTRDNEPQRLPLVRCGQQMQRGVEARWFKHEELLSQSSLAAQPYSVLDALDLRNLGIDSLMGSALTVQLRNGSRLLGVLCLTRRQSTVLEESQIQLARWATEILAESIQRFLSFRMIERLAKHDGLTDLANRRTFDAALGREVEQIQTGAKSECALLLMDLDRFKLINDHHGHPAGDHVLKQVARILREQVSQIRNSDRPLAARYGGEEMVLLLPGVSISGAMRIAEGVRGAIELTEIQYNQRQIPVTVSIGVAVCPRHSGSAEELLAVADAALYRAKSNGRNQVCLADASTAALIPAD